MKSSIRKGVVLFFGAALLVTVIAAIGWSYLDNYREVQENSEQKAVTCFELTKQILKDDYMEDFREPGQTSLEAFADLHPILQKICTSHDMEYLYVYQASLKDGKRHYLAFAERLYAQREGESLLEIMNSITEEGEATPLDEQERSCLAGDEGLHPFVLNNKFGYNLSWLVPFKDENGKVLALIGAEMSIERTRSLIYQNAASVALPIIIFLGVLFTVALLMINRRIIGPINTISRRMNSFVEDRSRPMEPLNIRAKGEIGAIARSFEKMSGDITRYLQELEELTREQADAKAQEDIARRIQYGLVPEHTALDPGNVQIRATTHPAKAVGGDFYDCFVREDGQICVIMGDVSGKGVSAALFMSIAKTVIRDLLKTGMEPAEALNQANGELCSMNPEGLFATVFAGVLEPASGVLRYANAGHNFPVVIREKAEYLEPDPGIALGLFEDAGIAQDSLTLQPGEKVLLYTDGVTEAVSREKEFFGEERLLQVLAPSVEDGKDPAEEIIRRVTEALEAFTAGCEQFDDICMLALAVRAGEEPLQRETLPAQVDSFDRIRERVIGLLGNTPKAREALLVCEEVLVNIVSYAGVEELAFSWGVQDGKLITVFEDRGIPFDPTEAPVEEKLFEEKDQGGMGLGLLREITDEMTYERAGDTNRLTLTLRVE